MPEIHTETRIGFLLDVFSAGRAGSFGGIRPRLGGGGPRFAWQSNPYSGTVSRETLGIRVCPAGVSPAGVGLLRKVNERSLEA